MKKLFTASARLLPPALLLAVSASLALASINVEPPKKGCGGGGGPCGDCDNPCPPGASSAGVSSGIGADATQSGPPNPAGTPNDECDYGSSPHEEEEDGGGGIPQGPQIEEEECEIPSVGERPSGLFLEVNMGRYEDLICAGMNVPMSMTTNHSGTTLATGGSNFSPNIFSRGAASLSGLPAGRYEKETGTEKKLMWTRTGDSFAWFQDIAGSTGYDIVFYDSADVSATNNPAGATPLRTVRIIQMPNESDGGVTVNVGRMLEQRGSSGGMIREFRFKAPAAGGKSWDLREGTFTGSFASPSSIALRIKTLVAAAPVTPGVLSPYTETRTITDITGGGSTVVSSVLDTFKDHATPDGTEIRLTRRQIDPGARNLTTLRYYYTSGPAQGKIMRIHYPSGNWRHYEYMTDNARLYRVYGPFGQSAPPASTTALPPVAGSVITESSFDSTPGWLRRDSTYINDNISRRTWSKKEGDPATTGVTWTEVQAYAPSAPVTHSSNPVTVSVHYPEASGVLTSSRIKRVETPDGQVRQYTYSELAASGARPKRIQTVERRGPKSGSLSGGLYTLTEGTQTITEKSMGGRFVAELVTDIASGKVLKDIAVDQADDFGRPTHTVDNLLGRYRYTSYACCGVEWEQDFDGLITGYGYDFQGNVIEEQKGYRPADNFWNTGIVDWVSHRTWERDVLGRVKNEKRVPRSPGPGTPQTIATYTYDIAGELTQTTDARGGIHRHSVQFIGNRRVEITSYPLSGTPALYRTEEKRYNRDGRLYSSRTYASSAHCHTVPASVPAVYTSGSGDIDNSVLEHLNYTYAQGSVYFTERVNNAGKAGTGTSDYRLTETDMLGRTYREGRPNAAGTAIYTTYTYHTAAGSSFGKLNRVDDPGGGTVFYTYDAQGRQLLEITDLNNNAIDLSTDRVVRREHSVVDANGASGRGAYRTVTSVYLSGTTPLQVSERLADASGLHTKITGLGGITEVTKTHGSSNGHWTVTTVLPDATRTTDSYQKGRKVSSVSGFAADTDFTGSFTYDYDSLGRLSWVRNNRLSAGSGTSCGYTLDDRIDTVTEPAAGAGVFVTTAHVYDALGNLTGRSLPGSINQGWIFNALGQMIESTGAEQYPVKYKYDDRGGRMRELTTGTGSAAEGTTTWTYNAQGWLTQKRAPATTEYPAQGADYTYQANGLLSTRQWARTLPSSSTRVTATYSYHAHTAALSGVSYNDAVTPGYSVVFDRLGRLDLLTQGGNSWDYAYDPAKLFLDTETITYDTDLTPGGDFTRVLDRSRDSLLRNTGWQLKNGVPSEHTNTYGYETNGGRLSSVTDLGVDTFTYDYVINSNLIEIVDNNYSISTWNVWENARDILDFKENTRGTLISKYDYAVNNLGKRTGVSKSGTAYGAGASVAWGYNTRGEVELHNHSNNAYDATYEFDTAGNRKKAAAASTLPIPGADNHTANTRNQYTWIGGVIPTYDEDGNLKLDSGGNRHGIPRSHTWDAENRLTKVTTVSTGADLATYRYDPLGRRISKTVGAVTTWFIYDGWNLIAEYQGATPALTRRHTWGLDLSGSLQGAGGVGGLLSTRIVSGGTTSYPLYDGNGNITQYMNSAGTIVAWYEHSPFGYLMASGGTLAADLEFRFSTKKIDAETDFYYYGYRYYSPWMARWINRDPIGEAGGGNLYGFNYNNSVDKIDFLGLLTDVDSDVLKHALSTINKTSFILPGFARPKGPYLMMDSSRIGIRGEDFKEALDQAKEELCPCESEVEVDSIVEIRTDHDYSIGRLAVKLTGKITRKSAKSYQWTFDGEADPQSEMFNFDPQPYGVRDDPGEFPISEVLNRIGGLAREFLGTLDFEVRFTGPVPVQTTGFINCNDP